MRFVPYRSAAQPAWKRVLILCAGSFNNFLLGLVVIFFLYLSATAFVAPTIASFVEGCPYEGTDGLQVGDRFVKVDGHRIYQYYDVGDFLRQGDGTYDLVLRRDGATFPVKVRYSWDTAMEFGRMVWMGLGQLVHGEVGLRDMSGPVGIVDLMAETGESAESTSDAMFNILYLGAFIAVNLAIMNMLPIPALDGGRVFLLLVTLVIETVTRRKLNPKYEAWIHAGGMALLLTLMAVIMFNDILKLFQ